MHSVLPLNMMATFRKKTTFNTANVTIIIEFVDEFYEGSPILSLRNILKSLEHSIFVVDNFVKIRFLVT